MLKHFEMVSSAIFRNDFSNQAKRHKILILTHIYRLSFPAANTRVRAVDLLWDIVLSHDYGLPHPFDSFLGAFCKIAKVTLRFVTSVCLSVCLSVRTEQRASHWTDFDEIWCFSFFRKSV